MALAIVPRKGLIQPNHHHPIIRIRHNDLVRNGIHLEIIIKILHFESELHHVVHHDRSAFFQMLPHSEEVPERFGFLCIDEDEVERKILQRPDEFLGIGSHERDYFAENLQVFLRFQVGIAFCLHC